ncbi:serine/threonine protein kinase [Photobacterium phosphoreum]|nr:serine/threonine protein kinase [Photobacterium phosphoreum]
MKLDLILEIIGNYQFNIIKDLGSGGFGRVEEIELFNATGNHSGFYARKLLEQKLDLKLGKERFIKEVILQSKLSHKNIVPIYLHNLKAEIPFFIMELAETDLQTEINEKTLSEKDKFKIIFDILNAIKFIHDSGYLHRDIKPNNILKYKTGVYKLSDFSLIRKKNAKEETQKLTTINIVLGFERYIAPELLFDDTADYTERSDIYSFGKVLDDMKIDHKQIKNIIIKATKMDSINRYESVSEIIKELSEINQMEFAL